MATTSPPRKLVILDLNGTLVVRSKAGRGAHVPPTTGSYGSSSAPGARSPSGGAQLSPRNVYSRPFLRSFQHFLTHPETRSWLDTMVWSSAQPHSVNSMVAHAFPGNTQSALRGVWTRKDLGLSEKEYFSKTQTTKDLSKVWREMREHSGATTVLVDDSVLKAHLQPYNHLCLPEYTLKARAADLSVLAPPATSAKKGSQGRKNRAGAEPTTDLDRLSSRLQTLSVADSGSPTASERSNTTAPADAVHDTIAPGTTDPRVPAGVDAALLAVIGVMSRLRDVGNVAGWIEDGNITRSLGDRASSRGHDGLSGAPAVDHGQSLWFENADVVRYWTAEGIRALDVLHIEVAHGIEAPGRH
ncbi:hypothetical protein BD626DRAFT_546187 [Schizophyllum amplum]|uniref:Mitochondrial import inner membrane translocase subunit TIM50 n=1 Tax=Schizophyllum amplum TaxID=97359 RepID=A0A550CLS2_9AGAR|nr:hypothetical protein BD626DRAFT_546187 [Auriculariopsis ampla]